MNLDDSWLLQFSTAFQKKLLYYNVNGGEDLWWSFNLDKKGGAFSKGNCSFKSLKVIQKPKPKKNIRYFEEKMEPYGSGVVNRYQMVYFIPVKWHVRKCQ